MTKELPILYSFRRCPYAMRARMALKQSGITVQLREIELRNKPQALLASSAKGTVPTLVLPDGKVIDESRDIMLWALSQNDHENWLADASSAHSAAINNLLESNDGPFKNHLDHYKYPDRYPNKSALEHRELGEQFLAHLENQLSNHRYLCSDAISLADIGIFPFIRQFASVDSVWFEQSHYHHLQAWLNEFLESELFHSVMKKYPVWTEKSESLIF